MRVEKQARSWTMSQAAPKQTFSWRSPDSRTIIRGIVARRSAGKQGIDACAAKYIFSVANEQHLKLRQLHIAARQDKSRINGIQARWQSPDHPLPTSWSSDLGIWLTHSSSLPFAVRSIRSTLRTTTSTSCLKTVRMRCTSPSKSGCRPLASGT
jgi:hypothetical protein